MGFNHLAEVGVGGETVALGDPASTLELPAADALIIITETEKLVSCHLVVLSYKTTETDSFFVKGIQGIRKHGRLHCTWNLER